MGGIQSFFDLQLFYNVRSPVYPYCVYFVSGSLFVKMNWSHKYSGAYPFMHLNTIMPSLYLIVDSRDDQRLNFSKLLPSDLLMGKAEVLKCCVSNNYCTLRSPLKCGSDNISVFLPYKWNYWNFSSNVKNCKIDFFMLSCLNLTGKNFNLSTTSQFTTWMLWTSLDLWKWTSPAVASYT